MQSYVDGWCEVTFFVCVSEIDHQINIFSFHYKPHFLSLILTSGLSNITHLSSYQIASSFRQIWKDSLPCFSYNIIGRFYICNILQNIPSAFDFWWYFVYFYLIIFLNEGTQTITFRSQVGNVRKHQSWQPKRNSCTWG